MGVSVNLRFECLVVLALDLNLGLKLFDLQLETRNLGAKLGEIGAHLSWLLRCLRHKLRLTRVLVLIRVATMEGLRRLLRISGVSRSRGRRIWLKSLSGWVRENRRRRESVGQGARPRVFWRRLYACIR
jgi:hypothetical protein